MLQGVNNEFGNDKSDANSCRGRNAAAVDQSVERDRPGVADQRTSEAFAQLRKVRTHLDLLTLPRSVQMLLDRGDRHDPPMRVDQVQTRLLRRYRSRLQHKDTGHELQAVADPVLHFLQQHFLLPQQALSLSQKASSTSASRHSEVSDNLKGRAEPAILVISIVIAASISIGTSAVESNVPDQTPVGASQAVRFLLEPARIRFSKDTRGWAGWAHV